MCRRMVADRLVVGAAGNVSVRVDDLIAVTPTAVPYLAMTPADVVLHRLSGEPTDEGRTAAGESGDPVREPTSEWPLHLAAYAARPEVGAVVHTHSVAATALSCLVDEVPAVHYYLAMFGGSVRVAPYAEYGSDALAAGAVTALGGGTACLLGNHGAVTLGASLDQAYDRAVYLEWLCEVALRVLSSGRPARVLNRADLDAIADRITAYGN
ncbi:MAG TPA: class II aldolase/adducin family protein [Cryptosporangiaceae bacterium]|nr:class II aldolase/adducin family protein [Cryptosporangiaceae bacterium]